MSIKRLIYFSALFFCVFLSCKKIDPIYEPEIKILSINDKTYVENATIEANPGDILKMDLSFYCEKSFEKSQCANTKGTLFDFIKTDGNKGDTNGTISLEINVDEVWGQNLFGGVFILAVYDKEQNLGTKSIQINRKK